MIPIRYSDRFQSYNDTPQYPYPMNFVQAQSPNNQVLVNYRGQPMLQGLSTIRGPMMFPVRDVNINVEQKTDQMWAYGVLDPYQQSFLRPQISYGFYPSRHNMYQGCNARM